ncbi:MAG: hypothetical protein Q4F66_12635 [Clostridium sp.]|nr:hypothetical protein [Clostridium sp.]
MRQPKESIKQIAAALGQQYTLMLIDEEWCLYRDLGNGYDIEINLNGIRKASLNATVKVWQVRDQLKVIQRIEGISDIKTLRRVLRLMINKTNRIAANRNKVYKPIIQAV